jgi:signal transduction histidine kinase/CheY-like chemotaxis protein/HAMP domain-containing protein
MAENAKNDAAALDEQRKNPFAWLAALSPLTFRGKAVLFLIPTIVIMSLVYTLSAIQGESKTLRNEIIKKGETIATIAARNSELAILSENREQLKRSALALLEIKDVVYITFFNKRSTVLLHEGLPHANELAATIDPQHSVHFVEHGALYEFTAPVFAVRSQEDLFFFQEKAASAPRQEHIGWVNIGMSKDVMIRSEREIMIRGALLAVLFTVVGVVLVYIFISLATRPLTALFNAVKEVRKGDYPEVQVVSPKSEAGRLSAEFNRMSQAIREREEAVIASERRIKDLFERVEHAIFRLDKTGEIIQTNNKFDDCCGNAKNFSALFRGDAGIKNLSKSTSGALRSFEETIISSDGSELVVSMSLYPDHDEHNTLVGFDGYFIDITDKKKLEDRLSQSQKMESVGLLAGGVAHDFNNLLTPILGYTDLLLATIPAKDTQASSLHQIKLAAERARDLTRQLLAFSRKQLLELKTANLGIIIHSFENMLRRTILENIVIEVKIAPDLGQVLADTGQIEQVLLNLAINAQDAMPNGGTLTIEAKNFELDESYTSRHAEVSPGQYVMLSVSDTGTGMDEEVRSHIFEPFFTTKELGRGTGLGLSTVYGIIKQHGGSVSVYSELGHGSVFTVFLPLVATQNVAIAPQPPLPEAVAHGVEIVLVVEDNEMVRKLANDMLTSLGYQVLSAEDPDQCIELVKTLRGPLHLLLTDVVMPKMNGVDLFNNLHLLRPDMKVLFMSGYASHIIGQHGVLDEGMHFIQKPFTLHALSQKIRQVLDT